MDLARSARIGRPAPLTGVLATVLAAGRCFRAASHSGLEAVGLPATFPPARAVLAAPLRSPAHIYGWVCLLDKVGADAFTDGDEQLARMLGAQVGRIYENGSLYTELLRRTSELAQEVGDRKRAEAEVRRTSDLLRAVADGTTDAVFVKDRAGKYLFFNQAAARFVGKSVADVLGNDDTALFAPDSARVAMENDRRVIGSGVTETTEEELTAAGATRTYLATKAPYRDAEGQIIGVLGISHDITDRKKTEAALRASEERFRAFMDHSPAAAWVTGADGRVLYLSAAYHRMFLVRPGEWVGRPVSELFPAHIARVYADNIRTVIETGRVLETTEPGVRADGTAGEFLVYKFPLPHPGGGSAVGGVAVDVTDRQRAEQRLTTEHAVVSILARAADLREAAPDLLRAVGEKTGWDVGALWTVNRSALVLTCAALWHGEGAGGGEFYRQSQGRTFGPGEGLPGRVWATRQAVWAADLAEIPYFQRAAAAEQVGLRSGFGFPISFGDELFGVAEFFSRDRRPPDPEVLRMCDSLGSQIGQFIERKRAEGGVRLFRALIDRTTDVIEVIDPETARFIDVNDRACVTLGYTRAEYRNLRVPDVDPTIAGRPWGDVIAAHRGEGTATFESLHRRKDGTTFPVEVNLNFIRLEREYLVAVVRDITERRHLEEQVRQSQKMEAIGQLAGGIAHDFNNLLTIINGFGEVLLGSMPPTDPAREMVQQMVGAGERAAGLTRQLLTFSRKAIIERKVLDPTAVVAGVQRMLDRVIGEDVRLTVATDPDVGAVHADPGQMEQVLLNLVVNARDAMPTGGHLTIELRNVELAESYTRDHPGAAPGPHVLLAVTDTGCGMDAATVSRVFEPFFTTKGERGTGLGLATVHGIVKQSGGHVAVYSEVGRGTTFKVYLPRVDRLAPVARSGHHRAPLPAGGETVLVVEDEAGVRDLTCHVLRGCGYTVLEAGDGTEAVRRAADHPGRIDLLVTDVVMPRMSGPALAERLAPLRPETRVLFLSGYTDDAVVRHGILEAGVAFLQKPFTPVSLAAKVREVLDAAR
ncbi:PAS domain S-box protein [Frigoriglobus tundricola]|uniref:histidine kinase n=1 Tax=Frigoriglobus tundricola TaxID=2774151 RepID=A0A6M5YJH7_9BACT|nr:PAS domain S-box protein [Frigoriglobus tundricola]QJW93704.1 hypothetical protein FTUN_1214 [Frigoriglobus tundricola]